MELTALHVAGFLVKPMRETGFETIPRFISSEPRFGLVLTRCIPAGPSVFLILFFDYLKSRGNHYSGPE